MAVTSWMTEKDLVNDVINTEASIMTSQQGHSSQNIYEFYDSYIGVIS